MPCYQRFFLGMTADTGRLSEEVFQGYHTHDSSKCWVWRCVILFRTVHEFISESHGELQTEKLSGKQKLNLFHLVR